MRSRPTGQVHRRRRLLRVALATAAAALAQRPLRAQAPAGVPLVVALAPFLSPAALLTAFAPLRRHLEAALAQPVQMPTARDFRALMEATRHQEHDIVQLPAHLARLVMADWGWQMIAAPTATVTVIVCVKDAGPVRSPADLRGRSVGMLDALSLTATVGRRWLQQQGLAGSVKVLAMASINSALFALDRDEVAAIVCADTQLASLPPATPRGERVLATVHDIPGPLFVARPDVPAAELARWRAAFEGFRHDPARPLTAANSPLRPLGEARLAALDGYVAIAREALAAAAAPPR
ncbi:MAG: PhnD/SsuA/transferrin family substrate-binding protein [Rubrivivax sp.]|nr:PhnD/SsuA/transferrin family substrate-binding protein [Rubrivivax sp.]